MGNMFDNLGKGLNDFTKQAGKIAGNIGDTAGKITKDVAKGAGKIANDAGKLAGDAGKMTAAVAGSVAQFAAVASGEVSKADLFVANLDVQYAQILETLLDKYRKLGELQTYAFNLDLNIQLRFAASVDLARFIGVSETEILHNEAEIDDFFL